MDKSYPDTQGIYFNRDYLEHYMVNTLGRCDCCPSSFDQDILTVMKALEKKESLSSNYKKLLLWAFANIDVGGEPKDTYTKFIFHLLSKAGFIYREQSIRCGNLTKTGKGMLARLTSLSK